MTTSTQQSVSAIRKDEKIEGIILKDLGKGKPPVFYKLKPMTEAEIAEVINREE